MSKKVYFLGPLYPQDCEADIKEKTIKNVSMAPNVFQWELIKGLSHWLGGKLEIINVLPVGIWPNQYTDLIFKDKDWKINNIKGHEVGGINLPIVKQFSRMLKTRQYIKSLLSSTNDSSEIIIYSAYLPFLMATHGFKQNITVIITDLPEYYDLQHTTKLRKVLRNMQNKIIYYYLENVDKFVVLTEEMRVPLKVEERPCICIEGICNGLIPSGKITKESKNIILYSGTLHRQYGIIHLLNAFKQLKTKEVELWICGSGEAEDEIKTMALVDDRIKFYGFCNREEVESLRKKASVLVNPRTNEGEYTKYSFPSKTMEYMQSGKPVVMFKLDGIPDEYDEYLFYADSNEPVVGLSSKLDEVFQNYNNALKKSKSAQKFVVEEKNGICQAKKVLHLLGIINSRE